MIKIAASLLAADFSCLYEETKKVEKEADSLHFDIMDGHFVPNITFGPRVVASLREKVNLPFEIHLMVENPGEWIVPFARAGGDLIIIHAETSHHLDRLITLIKKEGKRVGIALNPATSLCGLEYILSQLDLVLAMTVNPGFGAQDFLFSVLPKIKNLRRMAKEQGVSFEIEVDGGINQDTAAEAIKAGSSTLVVGTTIFGASEPKEAILRLKNI